MPKEEATKKRVILYARCSTELQQPEVQLKVLREYAARAGWTDTLEVIDQGYSGGTDKRPGLDRLVNLVRRNVVDVVCVVRLDRMFRSLKHILNLMTIFDEHQVDFISIEDSINFSTSIGKLQFQLLGAFSEFERSLIRERTLAGLDYARSLGKTLGRPRRMLDTEILELRNNGSTYRQIELKLGCSNSVIKRVLATAAKSVTKSDSEGSNQSN